MAQQVEIARVSDPAPSAPPGLSAFAAKVLDQLSLSAWLPGALFAIAVTVLLRFRANASVNLTTVADDISTGRHWIAVLVLTLPVLVLSVLVIQASSFAAIQFLEGYGAAGGPGRWARTALIRYQLERLNRLQKRLGRARKDAFDATIDKWKAEPAEVVLALQAAAYGLGKPTLSAEHDALLSGLDWQSECEPWQLARIDELQERIKEFPALHRILPTRLGNVLRTTEDDLDDTAADLSTFALRRRSMVPPRTQLQHDQFRARLDMYATLTVVTTLLAGLSLAILIGAVAPVAVTLVCAVFLLAALVAYRAAVASARGYASILRVMSAADGS